MGNRAAFASGPTRRSPLYLVVTQNFVSQMAWFLDADSDLNQPCHPKRPVSRLHGWVFGAFPGVSSRGGYPGKLAPRAISEYSGRNTDRAFAIVSR
jgi:hypothetical protein